MTDTNNNQICESCGTPSTELSTEDICEGCEKRSTEIVCGFGGRPFDQYNTAWVYGGVLDAIGMLPQEEQDKIEGMVIIMAEMSGAKEQFKLKVTPKLDAGYHGTREDFSESKWKVRHCADWEEDTQYQIDNPEGAEAYKLDIEKHGTRCIHCLWNDGDMCVHEKVEREREMSRSAKIESEALDEFEKGIAEVDKAFLERF